MKERATDFLHVLSLNGAIAQGELRFGPVCDALLSIRDLMMVYGDSMTAADHQSQRSDVHKVFADQLPLLLTSLETISARSHRVLKAQEAAAAK